MLSLLFPLLAFATTFGPISVVEQAQQSGYVIHGKIISGAWTEMEPKVQRPFTYWKLEVLEQPIGRLLGSEVTIRQPGGEIGEMGYRVAGSATFNSGEEVFVTLRDTDDRDTKEVLGLASGKYLVQQGSGGKRTVVNGLGIPLTGADGKELSPDEFSALLQRVGRHEETQADKTIFINKNLTHENHQNEGPRPSSFSQKSESTHAPLGQSTPNEEKPQNTHEKSEESNTGSSVGLWILLGGISLGLVGLVIFLRR